MIFSNENTQNVEFCLIAQKYDVSFIILPKYKTEQMKNTHSVMLKNYLFFKYDNRCNNERNNFNK